MGKGPAHTTLDDESAGLLDSQRRFRHVRQFVAIRRWALGVLIFEMVAGCPPFYHEDRVSMFKNICHVKYVMPAHFSKVRATVMNRNPGIDLVM
jgi:hypothetical protein